jgi:hypothetical protein
MKTTALLLLTLMSFLLCACGPEGIRSISLDREVADLPLGGSFVLNAEVSPASAVASLVWTSDCESVALVSDGLVKAVGEGCANIVASGADGSCRKICRVNVSRIYGIGSFTADSDGLVLSLASGNLQADIETVEPSFSAVWRFAAHQYDYLGEDSGNLLPSPGRSADLYGWPAVGSEAVKTYGIGWTDDYAHYGSSDGDLLCDWGNIDGILSSTGETSYPAGTWSTPHWREWTYMLMKRNASTINGAEHARFAAATVSGINGMLVFPDVISWPANIRLPEGINDWEKFEYEANTYEMADFAELEALGCAFLPAAGDIYSELSTHYGEWGAYWSSDAMDGPERARCVSFDLDSMCPYSSDVRNSCNAVRLAREFH